MNPRSDLATEMTQDDSRVVFEHVHETMRAPDATAWHHSCCLSERIKGPEVSDWAVLLENV
jgi:hypothetical protein